MRKTFEKHDLKNLKAKTNQKRESHKLDFIKIKKVSHSQKYVISKVNLGKKLQLVT